MTLDANAWPDADLARWRALAEKTLKGASLDSLRTPLADGVVLEPLYAAADAAPALDWGARDADRPWDVRGLVAHPTPAGANRQALDDLEGGAHSILLALDPSGARGLAASGPADLARALDGVMTDLAPVALDAGFQGIDAARWLSAAAKGGPAAPLAFHMDPLGAFATAGSSPGPMADWIVQAADAARALHEVHPRATLFLASGVAVHEAGGTPAQEIGFALSAAVAYAKACETQGLPRAEAMPRIVLGLAADARPLVTISKLRAARALWSRLAAALGAPCPARIEARGGLWTLAALDAWTNLIRLTAAGFGAAAGGADAVVLPAFTAPLGGLPTALARRQARNTQLVLMEEAGLGRVADPARGSGAVEALTDGFGRAAWAELQTLEAEGGALAGLITGRFAAAVAGARDAAVADVAAGRAIIVGVTRFTDAGAPPSPVEPWPPTSPAPSPRLPGADDACPPLTPVRVAQAFETATPDAAGETAA
jgi:methylmalonyl-CoA mutase